MPGPYPQEFREDVVAVARRRESDVTIKQIATDFGISEATLQNWLRQADVEEGNRPGQTAVDAAEARELKKRIRLLEQENEVLRKAAAYLSQANLKLGGSPKWPITEHWTSEGKLYCCAIKDVHSNRIVDYSISDRMTAKLAIALCNAVTRRGDVAGCILHADRGSQFRSRAMARELRRHDMVGSMGRVGAAGDNAAMESFWSLLQTNVLNQQRWATGPAPRDRRLDRAEVSPAARPGYPRRIDAHRIRSQANRAAIPRGLNPTCHPFVPHAP